MALQLKRFPEFGVELHIRSGSFTSDDLIKYFRSLGPADALRWIYYYDETADTSGIKLGHIPELKRIIAAKQSELFGDKPPRSAVVYGSQRNRAFFDFWISFTASGERRLATAPLVFPTLRAACERLSLPDAARDALECAVAAPQDESARRAAEQSGATTTMALSAALGLGRAGRAQLAKPEPRQRGAQANPARP